MRSVHFREHEFQVDEPVFEDDWVFWNDFDEGRFEMSTLDTVASMVAGREFIDIGAWLGPVTLVGSRYASRVVAVEPDPLAAQYLQRNVAANCDNVTVFDGAMNATTGTCRIEPHISGWASSMTRLSVGNQGTEVPCLTFPDLFDVYDIQDCALVKMDIEGGEAVVLEHAAPFLAEHGVPLLVAMHEPWWTRRLDIAWFDGYSEIVGEIGGWEQVLALP